MKFTNNPWYDKGQEYDGAVFSTDVNGEEVIIVDQYWANSGHCVEDYNYQLGNMELIKNAPLMYALLKELIEKPGNAHVTSEAAKLIIKMEDINA